MRPRLLRRRVLFAAAAALMAIIGLIAWARVQPIVSEAELEEAEREGEAVRRSLSSFRCERPAIFGAPIDSARDLGQLISDEGVLGDCIAAAADAGMALRGSVVGSFVTFEEFTLNETLMHQNEPIMLQAPIYDTLPASFAQILEACSDLQSELSEQALSEDRCSPLTTHPAMWASQVQRHPGLITDTWAWDLYGLATATSVLARRMAGSDFEAAIRLLLQGTATLRDLGSGAIPVRALQSCLAAERILMSTLHTLLLVDRTLDPLALARIDAAVQILIDEPAEDHALALGESLMLSDYYATAEPGVMPHLNLVARLAAQRPLCLSSFLRGALAGQRSGRLSLM